MNGEYWDGWFDHWGAPHAHTNPQQQAGDLDWILRQGYSISIYMFHGGTSFGWMNGANSNGKNYEPDVTSYDYDAALDESGHPTPKYFLFRDVIARDTGVTPPPVPAAPAAIAIPAFTMDRVASLWDNLPPPVHSQQPLTMEAMDQSYGYVLYRTTIDGPISGDLAIGAVHDYAQVYIDGKLAGAIDRRLNQTSLPVHTDRPRARLDILLENTGRVNFGSALPGERVGLLNGVTLAGHPLTGWDNYSLPMLSSGTLRWRPPCQGPCFYHATFTVDTLPTPSSTPANWAKAWSGSTAARSAASGMSVRKKRSTCPRHSSSRAATKSFSSISTASRDEPCKASTTPSSMPRFQKIHESRTQSRIVNPTALGAQEEP